MSNLPSLAQAGDSKPIATKDLPDYLKSIITDPVKRDQFIDTMGHFFDTKPTIAPGTELYDRMVIIFNALANLHPTPTKAQELQARFKEALGRGLATAP